MGAFDLGKYLADAGVKLDTEKEREQIEYISIDLIVPDPNNFYELSGLDDLASNIALCGLQQPLRVRPMPGDESQVVILSGHRRHAALQMLIDEGRDDLRDVPCIVEYGEEKPELTQLKLIYANASTRVMTDAEKARQAEQVEKLLYALKESGMEFPGRMRDHVAEVCKISTGKIAQLKFLKEQLIPAFLELWENGTLKNDPANAIAHMSQRHQQIFYNVISPNATYRMPGEWVASSETARHETGQRHESRLLDCDAGDVKRKNNRKFNGKRLIGHSLHHNRRRLWENSGRKRLLRGRWFMRPSIPCRIPGIHGPSGRERKI